MQIQQAGRIKVCVVQRKSRKRVVMHIADDMARRRRGDPKNGSSRLQTHDMPVMATPPKRRYIAALRRDVRHALEGRR